MNSIDGARGPHSDYVRIADQIASDIAAGRYKAGDRLPPQRRFAWERGIAISTASRVYAELGRRGLVTGEVGRGTFVTGSDRRDVLSMTEPASALVDLQFVFGGVEREADALGRVLTELVRSRDFDDALRPVGAAGTPAARDAAASFLARANWQPAAGSLAFTGNGRQALAAALAAVAVPGDRIGVEAFTYPFVKGIAAKLGLTLVPIAMDEGGLLPEALASAHRAQPLAAVYVQPSVQSPTAVTMELERRRHLAQVLERTGLTAIEDGVYSFLVDGEPPLAALAPDQVVYVDSLSKRIAPGLTVGIIAATGRRAASIATAIRSGGWTAPGLALAVAARVMADGTAERLGNLKRSDARARQLLAREVLGEFKPGGDTRAFHLWLPLADRWRGEQLAAAAAAMGIAVTPGSAFAAAQGHAPPFVRLALASPSPATLTRALGSLRDLILSEPDVHRVE